MGFLTDAKPQRSSITSVTATMKVVAALLLTFFAIVGCAPSLEKQVVGSWKIDSSQTKISGEQMKDEAMKKMAMAVLDSITLELKDDKSFDMTMLMPLKGTWALTGNQITLTPTLDKGETMSFGGKKTLDLTVAADAKSMTTSLDNAGAKADMVLTKQESAK
jgi:hypothetical protein